jgi:hypothetical protein
MTQNTETDSVLVWRDQAKDILELLSISDPNLVEDTGRFWNRVASRISVSPLDSDLANAKACLEQSGGTWDDDYELDGDIVIEVVYGELLAQLLSLDGEELNDLLRGQYQSEMPLEEEDAVVSGVDHNTVQQDVNGLVNQIIAGQIRLNPKWQRQFVWPTKKSQRYIESLLIDIPTPSILLYHQGVGELGIGDYFTVVDGRQRLETLLRFVATAEQLEKLGFTSRRFKTPKEDSQEFKTFQPGGELNRYANSFYSQLDTGIQGAFKGRKIPVTTIKARDRKLLYHIFGRYNTGSEKLNPAEVRNAVYQEVEIHNQLWELSRESDGSSGSAEEEAAIAQLKAIMGRKKRYGTYDFIGRVMAFTYLPTGSESPSANVATNRFYDSFDGVEGNFQQLRADFVKTFHKVVDWYDADYSFVKPPTAESTTSRSRFNAWAATIQMATTHHLLKAVEQGDLDEQKIVDHIQNHWERFAGIDPLGRTSFTDDEVGAEGNAPPGIFQMRQNPANFWQYQKDWLNQVIDSAN